MAARRRSSSDTPAPAKAAKRPARKAAPAPRKPATARKSATRKRETVPTSEPSPLEQRRADLFELRRRVLAALDLAEPGQVSALARELRAIDVEIVELVPEEVSRVDDLTARRAARRSGAATRGRSAVGK